MPKEKEHTEHAQHNINFLKTFYKKSEYNDWIITVCFYIAVHIIEGLIDKKEKVLVRGKEYSISGSDGLKKALILDNVKFEIPHSTHLLRLLIINYNFILKSLDGS